MVTLDYQGLYVTYCILVSTYPIILISNLRKGLKYSKISRKALSGLPDTCKCQGSLGHEQILVAALNNLWDAVCIVDKQERIVYANGSFTKITGYSTKQVIGKTPALLRHELTSANCQKQIWKSLNKGKAWTGAIQHQRKNREIYWARETITPIFDDCDNFEGYVTILSDISEEVRMKELLESQTYELETRTKLLIEQSAELDRRGSIMEAYSHELKLALSASEEHFLVTVHALTAAVDARDPYTAGHSYRVSQHAMAIARNLADTTADDLHTLQVGALLHDIGKIGIPDSVLCKPARLTDKEYQLVKLHPKTGYDILRNAPGFEDSLPIIRNHHEKLDGSGYPDELAGDEIPLLVRCVSIADVFDAITSARPYRPGLPAEQALEILHHEVEKGWWDGLLFEVFCKLYYDGELSETLALRNGNFWEHLDRAA